MLPPKGRGRENYQKGGITPHRVTFSPSGWGFDDAPGPWGGARLRIQRPVNSLVLSSGRCYSLTSLERLQGPLAPVQGSLEGPPLLALLFDLSAGCSISASSSAAPRRAFRSTGLGRPHGFLHPPAPGAGQDWGWELAPLGSKCAWQELGAGPAVALGSPEQAGLIPKLEGSV